ncbi:MAG: hypothetical protein ISS35_02390 [Kiritimatiellae bacterium]|nr:hypothetical protein [Kiritimatiellia bacterium]
MRSTSLILLIFLAVALASNASEPERFFKRPGVTADRQQQRVVLDATATDLSKGDTAEFLLVASGSGHDYESLAISKAKCSDILKALQFIGLSPGTPYNPETLRFWPKGERVIVTFGYEDAEGTLQTIRAEDLITDANTGNSLATEGFIFVGSRMIPDPETGKPVLAADLRDPMSVIANYNETESLLDVPRQAPQGDVYEQQTLGTNHPFRAGQKLRVMLTPEHRDGTRRVVNFTLRATQPQTPREGILNGAELTLSENGAQRCKTNDLAAVLSHFAEAIEKQRDPYVALDFDQDITLGTMNKLCSLVASLEGTSGIRIEPPVDGQLYYRAFIPKEPYRSRKARYAQPSELILKLNSEGQIQAEVVHITQKWNDETPSPTLVISTHPVAGPDALPKVLTLADQMPILLVFADQTITHATLMSYVNPVRTTHPTIHVYIGTPTD